MAKRGAKNKYETCVQPYLEEINKKVRQGVIEEEIAKSLGISVASLNNYKQQYPELKEALSKGKGADVLQGLVNAGIQAATGYYKENEKTTYVADEFGEPHIKQKECTKVWYPPNPVLNKFYVMNYGKEEGFVDSPLEYDLKKAQQEFDMKIKEKDNWYLLSKDKK